VRKGLFEEITPLHKSWMRDGTGLESEFDLMLAKDQIFLQDVDRGTKLSQ
jgi:hypothetical protein